MYPRALFYFFVFGKLQHWWICFCKRDITCSQCISLDGGNACVWVSCPFLHHLVDLPLGRWAHVEPWFKHFFSLRGTGSHEVNNHELILHVMFAEELPLHHINLLVRRCIFSHSCSFSLSHPLLRPWAMFRSKPGSGFLLQSALLSRTDNCCSSQVG